MQRLIVVLLALAALTLTANFAMSADEVAAPSADEAASSGPYVVKAGDTLSGIAGKLLGSPRRWRELWKANPEIKDPKRLKTGTAIALPGGKAASSAKAGPKSVVSDEDRPLVDKGGVFIKKHKKVDEKVISLGEPPKVKLPVAPVSYIEAAGYVSDDLECGYEIAGTPNDNKLTFAQGDEMFIEGTPFLQPGEQLLVFRPGGEIVHPATGKAVGQVVAASGVIRVKGRKSGFVVAEVEKSFREIYPKDRLLYMAKEPPVVYEPIPKNPALRGKWGYILASKEEKRMTTDLGVVYIDLGVADKVKPGDKFVVRRSGTPAGMPDVDVGEIQVISVRDTTATAMVLDADEPLESGFRLYYKN